MGLLSFGVVQSASAATLEYRIIDPVNVPGYDGVGWTFGMQLREYSSPLPHLLRADKVSYGAHAIDMTLSLDTDTGTVNVSGSARMENVPVERRVIGDRSTFEGNVEVDFTWAGVEFSSTDYDSPSALQYRAAATSTGSVDYLDGAYAGRGFDFFPKAASAGYTMRLQTLADGRIVLDGWFNMLGYHGNADFVFEAIPIHNPPTPPGTEVPEPASALLMLTGIGAALRRRKKLSLNKNN